MIVLIELQQDFKVGVEFSVRFVVVIEVLGGWLLGIGVVLLVLGDELGSVELVSRVLEPG